MIRVDRSDNSSARALTEATSASTHRHSVRRAGNDLSVAAPLPTPRRPHARSLFRQISTDSLPEPATSYDRSIRTILTTLEMRE